MKPAKASLEEYTRDLRKYLSDVTDLKNAMQRRPRIPAGIDTPPRMYCIEDFILTFGRRCTFGGIWKGGVVERQCFAMAYEVSTKHPEYLYVEGFSALTAPFFPVHHAWVVHRNRPDKAIEVSWKEGGAVYLGVAFRPEYLRECLRLADKRWYGALDTWWMEETVLNGLIPVTSVEGWPKPKERGGVIRRRA